jgi:hypothetical protein
MIEAIQTLIAAVESGYLKDNQWAAWAERALIESSSAESWLVELYDAETKETALAALYKGWNKLNHLASSLDQTALLLGFLYLRHLSGETNLAEFLQRTGALCDGNYNDPSCEAIYSLLNEYEGRTKPGDSNSLVARVDSSFSKHADFARTQFDSLQGAI